MVVMTRQDTRYSHTCATIAVQALRLRGKRGDKAREGDRMVQRLEGMLSMVRWASRRSEWKGVFRGWMVENPVGGLAERPYMKQWGEKHKLVDHWWWIFVLSAMHYYMKPTHVWTNVMRWVPGP